MPHTFERLQRELVAPDAARIVTTLPQGGLSRFITWMTSFGMVSRVVVYVTAVCRLLCSVRLGLGARARVEKSV